MSSWSRVCYLHKSFPFTEKRLRRPETGIKDGFEEMEHEFPFGKFRPEMRDNLFRCSAAPADIFAGTTQNVMYYDFEVSLGTIHKVFNVSISQHSYLSMTSTREQRLF